MKTHHYSLLKWHYVRDNPNPIYPTVDYIGPHDMLIVEMSANEFEPTMRTKDTYTFVSDGYNREGDGIWYTPYGDVGDDAIIAWAVFPHPNHSDKLDMADVDIMIDAASHAMHEAGKVMINTYHGCQQAAMLAAVKSLTVKEKRHA